ncbi:MAG: hypothetical protein PHC38_13005 [Weeksellaceae bacterium]|nr:hypothetical protein [Weeksellaceae bacterium]
MENFEQTYPPEKIERPPFLYHASPNRNIKKFKPRAKNIRNQEEGPVVFATPDLALATAFLVSGTNDSWTQIGKINGVSYIAISDKEYFTKCDKGGSIYKFSSDSFTCHSDKGMGENEWVSNDPVVPIEKTDVNSALEAMIDNGVQVYFIDKKDFNELVRAETDKEIVEIFKKIQSENQKRRRNVFQFDSEHKKL